MLKRRKDRKANTKSTHFDCWMQLPPGGRGGELLRRLGGQIVVGSWRVGGQIEGSWRVEVVNLCLQRPVAGPVTVLPATSWECPNSSLSPPIPLQLLFNLSFLQTESPHLSCLSSERCNQAEFDNWQSLLETSRYHELARSRKNMFDLTANAKWLPLLEILLCSSSRLHRQKLLSAKLYTLVALALQGFTPVCHRSCRNRGCVLRSTRLVHDMILHPINSIVHQWSKHSALPYVRILVTAPIFFFRLLIRFS